MGKVCEIYIQTTSRRLWRAGVDGANPRTVAVSMGAVSEVPLGSSAGARPETRLAPFPRFLRVCE